MRSSKYDRALLGPIVEKSQSLAEVLRHLGLPRTGGNYRNISARVRILGLDTSHFGNDTLRGRCERLTIAELEPIVARSTSIAQVLIELKLPPDGRAHHELSKRLDDLEFDPAHFVAADGPAEKRPRPIRRSREFAHASASPMQRSSSRTAHSCTVGGS